MGELRQVTFTVGSAEAGVRLDNFLRNRLRGLSREGIHRLLPKNLLSESGQSLKPATIVKAGLRFSLLHESPDEEPLPEVPIVLEDESVLVVNKPAGLAVHPAGRHYRCTLTAFLERRAATCGGERAAPAHRLDRETSGLLLCGRGVPATSSLKRAFANGEVEKTYLAVTEGWPTETAFEVDQPLCLGTGQVRIKMSVGGDKPARTSITLRRRYLSEKAERFALVECRPATGRQHQIRAHLALAGLPLVGDKIYGADETLFIRFTERKLTAEDRRALRLERHALHAASLEFEHPNLGKRVRCHAPLPRDLSAFLEGLTEA